MVVLDGRSQIGLCNERRDATNTRKSRPRHTHYRLNITTYNKADSNVCPVRDIAFRTRLTRRAIAAPNCTETRPLALATMASVCAVLIAFAGYLVRRGYLVGIVEAISISIFIGFA